VLVNLDLRVLEQRLFSPVDDRRDLSSNDLDNRSCLAPIAWTGGSGRIGQLPQVVLPKRLEFVEDLLGAICLSVTCFRDLGRELPPLRCLKPGRRMTRETSVTAVSESNVSAIEA
jgi:hypothetical protein